MGQHVGGVVVHGKISLDEIFLTIVADHALDSSPAPHVVVVEIERPMHTDVNLSVSRILDFVNCVEQNVTRIINCGYLVLHEWKIFSFSFSHEFASPYITLWAFGGIIEAIIARQNG
jgi:hypothetical protein